MKHFYFPAYEKLLRLVISTQHGPITFDPRTTLLKHVDLRATSNKMSQD